MSKTKKVFLVGSIILAILVLIYIAIPKYQIYTVKVDDHSADFFDRVLIIKLNTLTGETKSWYKQYDPNPSNKLDDFEFSDGY